MRSPSGKRNVNEFWGKLQPRTSSCPEVVSALTRSAYVLFRGLYLAISHKDENVLNVE